MNIRIKKIYLVYLFSIVAIGSGWVLVQEFIKNLDIKTFNDLVLPFAFIFSLIYLVNYFMNFSSKVKTAEEVAKELYPESLSRREEFKEHIGDIINNESYTFFKHKQRTPDWGKTFVAGLNKGVLDEDRRLKRQRLEKLLMDLMKELKD